MNDYAEFNNRQLLNQTIEEGNTGEDVIILQEKLKILGYYDASITGSFDEYTKWAVMKFQKAHNLSANGIVDNETWKLLYDLTSNPGQFFNMRQPKPVLRIGSTGPYVTELQTILTNLLYYAGEIDGNFGTDTERAVKAFQVNNRLTSDGIVGRDTWSALATLYSPLAICEDGNETITYTVIAGDTLWSIAKRFNTTVDAIKKLNNLTNDSIFIGQQLKIPTSNESPPPTYVTYTIVAGDTLWSIARKFNTTVDAIKNLNNLTSDLLSIGQQLKIPTSNEALPPTYVTYTVVAGDTLWSIARKFNTTVDIIKNLNNLTSNLLSIGQQLRISSNG